MHNYVYNASRFLLQVVFKGECSVFLKKIMLWIKTIYYLNTLRSKFRRDSSRPTFNLNLTEFLVKLQKKVVRLISNSNYIAHTKPIYKNLRLLKLTDMFPIAVWKFYYKLMNNQLPEYFVDWKPELPMHAL